MISLPIGGVADTCWLCGRSLPEDPEHPMTMVGLNGVACPDCGGNIAHYTPRRWTLCLSGERSICLYEYVSHRSSEVPSIGGTVGLVFLEDTHTPIVSSNELRQYYRGLSQRIKRLVWLAGSGVMPEDFREVVAVENGHETGTSAVDSTEVQDYHLGRRTVEDGNVYVELRKHLPRPYIIGAGGVYANINDERQERIQRIATNSDSDDPGQGTLGQIGGTTESPDSGTEAGDRGETTRGGGHAQQADLGSFEAND